MIIQKHHLIYADEKHKQREETVKLYRGEHWVIVQLNRRKNISKGFIKSLKLWILLNEDKAKCLNLFGKENELKKKT